MSNVKILLVDDSAVMLRHISGLLAQKHWQVVTASNVIAAVEAFHLHLPQAVVADFVLEGGHTGLEAVSAIFSTLGEMTQPAAALLTQGSLGPADQQKASALEVIVLQKPVRGREREFLATVETWLRASNLVD